MSDFEFNYKRTRDKNTLNGPAEINVSIKLDAAPGTEDYKKLLEVRNTLEDLAKKYVDAPKSDSKTKKTAEDKS